MTKHEADVKRALTNLGAGTTDSYYVPDSPHDALYAPQWCYGLICLKCGQQHPNARPKRIAEGIGG